MAASTSDPSKVKEPEANAAPSTSGTDTDGEEKKDERLFECNICLDAAKDAVVSLCGHLFW